MKLKGTLIVFTILFLIFSALPALAIGIEAALGVWSQGPQGDMGYKGDSLSLKSDLKYSSTKTEMSGRAKIDMPLFLPNIYLMATPMKYTGNGVKSTAFRFGNILYAANVPYSSELKLDHYDIGLYYGIPFLKTATLGKLNVDVGLNVRFMDMKGSVTQGAISESKSFMLPLPMLYAAGQLKVIGDFSVEAETRSIAYSSNHYIDVIGRLKYKVFGPAFVGAGYRYEKIKVDHSDLKVDISIGGPFAEVGVKF